MTLSFPAVIKEIRFAPHGIIATLDISPENVTPLSDLIEKMVTVSISTEQAETVGLEERLPFEPENDDVLPDESPAPRRRPASGRKRAE